MTHARFLPTLTLLSLSTLAFGAAGCSNGQSPTEPAFDPPAAAKSLAVSSDKRHGTDDPAGDDHGGRGNGGQQQRPPRAAFTRWDRCRSRAASSR
jgi:poly(3-hydroxybutyrate) depolymerase